MKYCNSSLVYNKKQVLHASERIQNVSHLLLQPEGAGGVGGEDGAMKEPGMQNLGEVA